jgi:DNA-binding ferritin-like protein (Dps family)
LGSREEATAAAAAAAMGEEMGENMVAKAAEVVAKAAAARAAGARGAEEAAEEAAEEGAAETAVEAMAEEEAAEEMVDAAIFDDMLNKTVMVIANKPEAFKKLVKAQGSNLLNSNKGKGVIKEFQESTDYKDYNAAVTADSSADPRPTTLAAARDTAVTTAAITASPPRPLPPSSLPSSDGTPRDEAPDDGAGAMNASAPPARTAARTAAVTADSSADPRPTTLAPARTADGLADAPDAPVAPAARAVPPPPPPLATASPPSAARAAAAASSADAIVPGITSLIQEVVVTDEYKSTAYEEILSYLRNAVAAGKLVKDVLVGDNIGAVATTALRDILTHQDIEYDLTRIHRIHQPLREKEKSFAADAILRNLRRRIHLNSSIISSLRAHVIHLRIKRGIPKNSTSLGNSSIAYLQTEINNVGIINLLKTFKEHEAGGLLSGAFYKDFYGGYISQLTEWNNKSRRTDNPSSTLVKIIEQMIQDLPKKKEKVKALFEETSREYDELINKNEWIVNWLATGTLPGTMPAAEEAIIKSNKKLFDDYNNHAKQLANIIKLEEHVLTIYAYAMAAVMIKEDPNALSRVSEFIDKIKKANDRLTAILNEQYDYMDDVDIAKREIARNSQGGGGGARTKLIGKRTKKINYYNNKRIKTGLRRTKGRNNGQRRTKGRNNGQRRTKGRIS